MHNPYQNIIKSIAFLGEVVNRRLRVFFEPTNTVPFEIPPMAVDPENSPLNEFLLQYKPNIEEYTLLLLALVPHLQPNFLDTIVQQYLPQGGEFSEIGGVKVNNHRGMLPTGETVLFILAGNDIPTRLRISQYFSTDHFFYKNHILSLEPVKEGEPQMSGRIILSQEYVDLLTLGKIHAPAFSQEFPAKLLETEMTWDDLVLHPATLSNIKDISLWLKYHEELHKDPVVARKIKHGYRALFYGPPGTGKTLTASLLGKEFNRTVYRIDLSQVVSKFIGETEKNLEKIFAKAENREWMLFFDEADALFGKRSSISSAHDKYANQEVSYLLQRIEDYAGLVILASNFKNNIDQAFIRRFNAIIHFPAPNATERLLIWQKNVPDTIPLSPEVNLKLYADKYELSGSAITNIMQHAALLALSNGRCIYSESIQNSISRELRKEDKLT